MHQQLRKAQIRIIPNLSSPSQTGDGIKIVKIPNVKRFDRTYFNSFVCQAVLVTK